MKTLFLRLEKWRWLLIALIGVSLLWVEIQEFLTIRILNQAFHYFEVFQYAVLLISTGLLLELFARSTKAHRQAVSILENKHGISLELASQDDWKSLIQKLTMIPSRITDVEETYLLINDPLSGEFESVGHWVKDELPGIGTWDPAVPCSECLEAPSYNKTIFHMCQGLGDDGDYYVYSLEVFHRNIPTTLLRFRVNRDARLTHDEEEILRNIRDEIIVAIQSSQDRKRLSEMQTAEVAMAERRTVSTYVHDQLGQNLGYMHMKLDQLSTDENVSQKDIQKELNRLREVANESYEIVRDILKKLQSETIPHLTNLLHEPARTVSRRSQFELNFESQGAPIHLAPEIQQIVFFTFREILSNVEKHASADKVDIHVIWNSACLDISVADNGKGFDPGTVQKNEHFGLEIMQERISNINGKLQVNSSRDTGTVVSMSIPTGLIKEVTV